MLLRKIIHSAGALLKPRTLVWNQAEGSKGDKLIGSCGKEICNIEIIVANSMIDRIRTEVENFFESKKNSNEEHEREVAELLEKNEEFSTFISNLRKLAEDVGHFILETREKKKGDLEKYRIDEHLHIHEDALMTKLGCGLSNLTYTIARIYKEKKCPPVEGESPELGMKRLEHAEKAMQTVCELLEKIEPHLEDIRNIARREMRFVVRR